MSLPCRPQKCSAPDEHLLFPRSLDSNYLTGYDSDDMSGVIKLAEMLPQTKLQSLRRAIYVTPPRSVSPP